MTDTPETPTAATDREARRFTMSIDIDATPEDVWRALTDAGELVRWFPLEAGVKPGKGGSIFWKWDERWTWESQIDAWEPGKLLRLVEHRPAFDANGAPIGEPQTLAMEFTLETHAGRTRLKFVHSGFGRGASWDDELESISSGWQFELRGLRHYLEHHKGRDRHHALLNTTSPLAQEEVWQRLMSPAVFTVASGDLTLNGRCTIATAAGDRVEGTVAWLLPSRDLFMTVDDLASGIFRIVTWRGGGETGLHVWLATYDARHAERVREFGRRTETLVTKALANQ